MDHARSLKKPKKQRNIDNNLLNNVLGPRQHRLPPWPLDYLFPNSKSFKSSFLSLEALNDFSIEGTVMHYEPLERIVKYRKGTHFNLQKCQIATSSTGIHVRNNQHLSSFTLSQHELYNGLALRYQNARLKGFPLSLALSTDERQEWKDIQSLMRSEQVLYIHI